MKINELVQKAHRDAVEKGFYAQPREIGTALMLIVSELAEALEADRKGKRANIVDYELMLLGDIDRIPLNDKELTEYLTSNFEVHIKDTLEDELADAVIRICDLCGHLNINLGAHIHHKLNYNKTRNERHGKAY